MHALEHRMAEARDDLDAVLERYSFLQHEFERQGGFEYAAKAEAILLGLGFGREMWTLETEKLSGGQQNRLGLARLLLAEPDVLLLDEPTNHLDVDAVEWLEEFLASYRPAYIIISHDRYFLDRCCTRIVEMENGRAVSYNGNYSAFLVERDERREAQRRAYENQRQLIAKTEEFIRRNLAGQKTKQAKSRRNMLERLERVEAIAVDQSSGDFRLQKVQRAGNNVLMAEDAAVGYSGKLLAAGITFTLKRSECLGIIGPNGSGKTTFLKTVLGKIPALRGEVRWGTNVQIGYYAQQLDDLDDRNEIIMELRRVASPSATAGELRSFLAKFLFTGDDVYKHVRELSGGEKGRLALAKLIYSQVNVLVLDEPTNHLDIPSREALEEALGAYDGTILTISHDRYFLDRVATQILSLDGRGGSEHYDGDYTEYHDWKAARRAHEEEARIGREKAASEPLPKRQPSNTKTSADSAKSDKKRKSLSREPGLIEEEIAAVEKELALLADEMSRPEVSRDRAKLQQLNADYGKTEERMRKLFEEWEQVSRSA
jgi:ATP-binding cassette subfamily F protein 3